MLQNRPTDEQIAAQEERIVARETRAFRTTVTLMASFGLLMAAVILLALLARANFISAWLFNGVGMVLLLAWLAYIFLGLKPGAPLPVPDPDIDEDYLRNSIDFQQRRGRASLAQLLWNLSFLAFLFTVDVFPGLRHPERIHPVFHIVFLLIAAAFACLALVSVLILTYGSRRAINDELSRAQRAKAGQFGHILAVAELAAMLLVSAYRPQWVLMSLPLAVAMAVALPGAYFVYLEWRSSRG